VTYLYHLPTKEECDRIVAANDTFIKKEQTIRGNRVVQYSYMLASWSDFEDPLGDGSLNARELRGITFVEQDDGGWRRFLMLSKFHNVNETIGWMEEDLEYLDVVRVDTKFDGSLISPIELEDGSVVMKSKFSFESDQAVAAQDILDGDPEMKLMVKKALDSDIHLTFEYVAPDNRIVLMYPDPKLVLLQARSGITGKYLDLSCLDSVMGKTPSCENAHIETNPEYGLEDLLAWAKNEQNIEGWVVQFSNGKLAKIKTDWYFKLHGLVSQDGTGTKMNSLIACAVDELIDDVLSQIPLDFTDVRERIITVSDDVVHYVNGLVGEISTILHEDGDLIRKDFAIRYREHPMFSIMMRLYGNEFGDSDIMCHVKMWLLKKTKNQLEAESFYEENIKR